MRRLLALSVVGVAVACADPPSADVTRGAAGHTVFARQHDECIETLHALRHTRNHDENRMQDLEHERDQAHGALESAPDDPDARSAFEAAEAALGEARARYDADRDAVRRREAECDALHQRMREVR